MFGKTIKSKLFFVFTFIMIYNYSLINAMTKDIINNMQVIQRKKIDDHERKCDTCQQRAQLEQVTLFPVKNICSAFHDITKDFHRQVAEKTLNASDLTDLEKLSYLPADEYFEQRKEIIKRMVIQGIHPNNIKWDYQRTPLSQALLFKDYTFETFLIQHGASENK